MRIIRLSIWWASLLAISVPITRSLHAENELDRLLEENAIRIASLDPTFEQFEDLKPLQEILNGVEIVMLGESTHGDGKAFLLKSRLIKYLHQERGFDVLVFESGLWNCRKAWENISRGEDHELNIQKSVYSLWSRNREVSELIDYIGKVSSTEQPLELAGIDCQFTGELARDGFMADFSLVLKEVYEDTEEIDRHLEILDNLLHYRYSPFPANRNGMELPEREERSSYLSFLAETQRLLEKSNVEERGFWLRVIENMKWEARRFFGEITWSDMSDPSYFIRDRLMGENLIWLKENLYPRRKVIVWGASMHLALRREDNIRNLEDGKAHYLKGAYTAGSVVSAKYRSRSYSIGVTSYNGSYGRVDMAKPYERELVPMEGSQYSIENQLAEQGYGNILIDLRSEGMKRYFGDKRWIGRFFGYRGEAADWTEVFDGVLFIKTMAPSHGTGSRDEQRK